MSNSLKIVERVREHVPRGTDYAVAKALGMTQSNLARITEGKGHLGDKAQRLASTLLGLSFQDVNALVNEDKAKTESERSYWRALCAEGVRAAINAAGKVAATVVIATGLNIGSADALSLPDYACNKNIHYAHLARALVRWIGLKLRSLLTPHHRGLAGPIPRFLRCPSVAT